MADVQANRADLDAALDVLRSSPADGGVVELIVRRPAPAIREVIDIGRLTVDEGLVGDSWKARGSRHTPDGSAEPGRQLTVMNSRAIALFAGDKSNWAIAGDQLYIDLDLSDDNLPAGTRLLLGDAVIEVSVEPHTGCAKFKDRFGLDVSRFINSPEGQRLHLRGINCQVITSGTVRTGDRVFKREGNLPA